MVTKKQTEEILQKLENIEKNTQVIVDNIKIVYSMREKVLNSFFKI